jgi:hypothetical protein
VALDEFELGVESRGVGGGIGSLRGAGDPVGRSSSCSQATTHNTDPASRLPKRFILVLPIRQVLLR